MLSIACETISGYLAYDTVMAHTERWQELLSEMERVVEIYNLIAYSLFLLLVSLFDIMLTLPKILHCLCQIYFLKLLNFC